MKFTAVIKIRIGNPYILISKTRASSIKKDWKRPIPVLVKINNKPDIPWRINMMPVGNGTFYLYLHGYVRKESNTKVGDTVAVDVSFDDKYKNGPMHPMPVWFRDSLLKDETAKKNWEALTPSRKKEILRYFSWLKSKEARKRNLKKVMHILSGNPGRFMARFWDKGK